MIRKEYQSGTWEFPFVLYSPKEDIQNLPVVIQLHGAGEVGRGEKDLHLVDVHGFSNMMKENVNYPCLFVMPQCPPDSFWAAEILNLHAFIERLVEYFQADRSKIYLTGLSMGGYGTWLTACRFPKTFAAIAPVCGGGMVWKAPVLDMPVWAFHGTEDETVFPTETINMIHRLRQARPNDPNIKMTLLDGVAHNAWTYAYNETLLNWLLMHKR